MRAITVTIVSVVLTAGILVGSKMAYAQGAALPTLYIIGDSTVHNPLNGLEGWGDAIGAQFDSSKIHVENYLLP